MDPQTGVFAPAHQRLCLRLLAGSLTQTGAARAHLPQDKLADAKVEAQDHDVDAVDQQQTGSVVPVHKKLLTSGTDVPQVVDSLNARFTC